MATCKNCGKPLILSGGKCVYCGASPYDIPKNEHRGMLIKKTIDIVFCIDCSWPMAPILDSIKDNIAYLIEEINQYNKGARIVADWRARVMGFRNFEEDNEYLLNDNPFVSTLEDIQAQLNGIVCKGCSENSPKSSSLDAIWCATETTKWRDWESSDYPDDYIGRWGRHSFVVLFTANKTLTVNIKTKVNLSESNLDVEGSVPEHLALCNAIREKYIVLTVFGPNDPELNSLLSIPYSQITLFEDPIDFYYHKQLDFSSIINTFDETLS